VVQTCHLDDSWKLNVKRTVLISGCVRNMLRCVHMVFMGLL
jgi:hypothetical protein